MPVINRNNVPGFATINYDHSPSPLTVLGGGTNSIFGPGGVVDGIGSVMRNFNDGNILGAILSASNTYNNALHASSTYKNPPVKLIISSQQVTALDCRKHCAYIF